MLRTLLKTTLVAASFFVGSSLFSQCPTITCPANMTVNNDPGSCDAVVNYTPPVGTDPCGSGGTGATLATFNYTGAVVT